MVLKPMLDIKRKKERKNPIGFNSDSFLCGYTTGFRDYVTAILHRQEYWQHSNTVCFVV